MASYVVLRARFLVLLGCFFCTISPARPETIQLEGFYGIIKSPNFPHPYATETEVTWNITVPSGRKIRLTFTEFDLENSWQCESDTVTFFEEDGVNGTFCGDISAGNAHAPPIAGVTSKGNNMIVTFNSDHSDMYRYTGFRAIFVAEDINECENENGGCVHYCHDYIGGFYCSCKEHYLLHEDGESCVAQCSNNLLTDLTGVIKTPEYPDAYPGYSDCDWTIDVGEGYVINVAFNDFEIEDHPDVGCPYDSLMIEVDGETHGPFCGTSTNDWPQEITSSGHTMKLKFHSDKLVGLRGVKATYRVIPKQCEDIEAPTYGSLSLVEMTFNQVASFSCDSGYELDGSSERACLSDGTWSGMMPFCRAVDCSEPPRISNGQVNSASNNFTFTNTITYQCNPLYILVGGAIRTCQADATWSDEQPYCEPICGESKVPPREAQRSRIVGGQEAAVGSWPWIAYLEMRAPRFGLDGNTCGGSLINEYWIATAAHCVSGLSETLKSQGLYGATIPPNTITVRLGLHRRSQPDSHVVERTCDAIYRPSDYDVDLYDADIALLHMTQPVQLTDRIRPICLPGAGEDVASSSADPEADVGIIMGWGRLGEFAGVSDTLQEAYVPLVENDVCQNSNTYTITDHMICAGFEAGGRDACQGDSGGPLVTSEAFDSSTYTLKGIISWGEGCARPGKYGVYVRVENFVDWIEEVTHIDRIA